MRNPLRSQRVILFVSLLSLIGFLFVVFLKSGFTEADLAVSSWTVLIRMSSLTLMARTIAYCFDTIVLLLLSLLVAYYYFKKGYSKCALLFLGSMSGIAALVAILKLLVYSPRPLNSIMEKTALFQHYELYNSFPSGHVTGTAVFFGLLVYFMWQHLKSSNVKISLSVLFVMVEILIGFSRLYLNVHWLSDVTGGYLLGSFWLTFSILLFSMPIRLIDEARGSQKFWASRLKMWFKR